MFKTPTQKSITSNAVKVGSAIGGGMLSNGVVEVVPAGSLNKNYVRGGLAVVALLAAASIKGKDTTSEVAQYALAGMSIEQGRQVVTSFLKEKTGTTAPDANAGAAEKFVAGALGCACQDAQAYKMPMPMLQAPQVDSYGNTLKQLGIENTQTVSADMFS